MNYLNSKTIKIFSLLMLTAGVLSSCKKDKEPQQEEPTHYYKLERIENFAPAVTGAKTFYFNFETKKEIAESQVKSADWDLAFGGTMTCMLSGNNGNDEANYGVGSTAKGGILILEKPFEEVNDVPADADFKTGKNLIGLDAEGVYGSGIGWCLYDSKGTIRGDGSADKQHVIYAMPEKRTVIIRTAKGDYAKIKMISGYKDAFTADKWFMNTPHMFYTFEYVVVPKGSTKFQIK
ncbi:MAG: HmuY family protein [Pedobacter sp.]|uniref:HmuY family protein n=1 Tax=Pedobacter sp. TaxID=1411316 RepID=UPI003565A65E